ncbi:MAG TPA: YDG/SRA domain-containing protein [Miltoncostaeaceae bacterium]|nr:YDG/SRA domain-containing protein [Miltoncostaeaceae bacterium]
MRRDHPWFLLSALGRVRAVPPLFGHIPGVAIGTVFENRAALAKAGVHRQLQAGISGGAKEGADSIVLSGGYPDDEDYGDLIVYTGHGGRRPGSRKHVEDQQLAGGNLALARSSDEGLPVRVVRGSEGDPAHSPERGYRYDGLYSVVRYWDERGRDGFRIWRFQLAALDVEPPVQGDAADEGAVSRRQVSTAQLVRRREVARALKELHDHRCQICGISIATPAGPYAEAAHIRPLGRPHDGPDELSNMLCLCPNHHVAFDSGALVIDEDFMVREVLSGLEIGRLSLVPRHVPHPAHLHYHRGVHHLGRPA